MDNHTTARDIVESIEAQLGNCTHKGDTTKARCPAHDDTHPSLDIKIGDNGDCVLLKCWAGCETEDVVAALGMTMPDLFASDGARAPTRTRKIRPSTEKKPTLNVMPTITSILDPAKLPGAPEKLKKGWGAADWDIPDGVDALEAIRGAARSYEAREIVDETNEALIEDTPLPGDVSGRVQAWIASLKAADLEGKRRILYLIAESDEWQQLGADLRIVVVDAIKGQARSMATVILGRYDDRTMAWREPPGKAEDTSAPGFKLVWDIEAQPDPRAVVPGLLYEGHQTVIEAGPKWGKTSLIVDAVASAYASGEWLGESCDEPGPILWISEMAEPLIRAWLARRLPEGVRPDIYVSPICSLNKLAAAVEEIHPSAVIVDSFIAAFRAERPNAGKPDEWRAGDVREFFTRLRDICPTSLTTNHVRKSDGAGRDSGDLHAAVDLLIELRDEDSKRHYTAPELNDRRRTLHYAGRILHGRVTHCQMEDDFGFTVVNGHGSPSTGGGGGKVDPFTVGEPPDPLDAKINGFLMKHPEGSSQKSVAAAVGGRKETAIARLKMVAVRDTKDKKYRHKDVPAEASPMVGLGPRDQGGWSGVVRPMGTGADQGWSGSPTLKGTRGPDQGSGLGVGNTDRDHAHVDLVPLAHAKTTPTPSTRGGWGEVDASIDVSIPAPPGGEPAEKGDAHDSACPGGCSGTGSVNGKACNWDQIEEDRTRQPIEGAPTTHTSGIKKWDDATSTWVDTLPGGDVFMVEGGIVHLSERTTVTDGDPNIHWDMTWTDIELDREEMVDYQ